MYAYDLKAPLMKTVFGSVLCGIDSSVNAFGRGDGGCKREGQLQQLLQQGRLPITTYATVQMQSDAWQDDDWKNS